MPLSISFVPGDYSGTPALAGLDLFVEHALPAALLSAPNALLPVSLYIVFSFGPGGLCVEFFGRFLLTFCVLT